jgi:hypothetical protein
VELVSSRPGLGYDIKSFDADGKKRFIEVKNVSGGNRFFLSDGEWRNSRARSNYRFYLVSGAERRHQGVSFLPSSQLRREHLQPMHYLVRFSPRRRT